MDIRESAQQFRDIVFQVSRAINSVGVLFLMAMMFLMVVDVFLRRVFNQPLTGSFEVVQLMQVTLVYLGVAYTTVKKAHISIDLITSHLSDRTSALLESIVLFLSLGFFALITWRNILRAEELWTGKATSVLLTIPLFPFYYMLAFGCGVLCLVLLVQLVEATSRVFKGFPGLRAGILYSLLLGVVFLGVALCAHWIEWEVDPLLAGVLGIAMLFILMAVGMPIAFSMGLVGFAGYCYVVGVDAGFSQLESVPYGVGSDYILSVLPLFLLMGQFAFYSGLSQDLYDTSYKWLGHYPGGLAMATVGGCAAFAAVCGSSVATSATMGTVALPAMRKYKYDDRLALGSIAAGGTVGILIPPSIVFILYGVLTEQSIGKLFLAGFLPGVLAIVLYLLAIIVQVRLNPKLGPAGPKAAFREKLISLGQTWGTLLLFSLVMGGIYFGFFTPTEAGAVGAFGAFVMAILKKKLTWQTLYNCLLETGRMTAMLIIIFVGAMMFNYFLAVTNVPMEMAQLIVDQNLDRYMVLTAILVVYLLLGCIMDPGSMIILTIPIVYPMIQSLGFNPIWFGVIIVMVAEIGTITPPVGLNVFVVKAVAPEVPITRIFRGIFPFWAVDMVRLFILVSIPQISLFLPNVMR
ncbi:MAG: TRAP transporter large permease subunit [Deltaproteobacteria bacterium]|jgi:C4-dicarboxylate transporter, DctM subunit|nr:TRAP transporter large permease subunit [Deltaproteobacteria bacterium]